VGRDNSEKVQDALYRIAELAGAAQDMQEFYGAIHEIVGELMEARSMFIALYDDERRLISWPYYLDEIDPDFPERHQWFPFGQGEARGVTAYILRTGKPLHLTPGRLEELIEEGEVELLGKPAEDWLGVPLRSAEARTVGVLAVASYTEGFQYTDQDEELLAFVGQHVGAALSRARAIEETRQRNAELALINSVQDALAGELELQAIYDGVGDKVRDVFDAQTVFISTLDEVTGLQYFPYVLSRGGGRLEVEPNPPGGFSKHVLDTRESLLIAENMSVEAERYGSPTLPGGEDPKSGLFVPLVVGEKATGVISLQNLDREHAFSASDQQLLETLAGSLSVALENARLVHETRQRNAELALINGVQDAIAGELDQQAIYDAVGDKIQEIFDAQVVAIRTLDAATGLVHAPYIIESGERLSEAPTAPVGFTKHVLESRESVLVAENLIDAAEKVGSPVLAGVAPKSALFVPLLLGGKALGAVSLQNLDREHAFGESDQQLLETLAGSLSVALENARLVHETRQRNAELALINSVQDALAGELELRAIYDAVGDRIRDVFDAEVVDIAIYDEASGLLHFPYAIERGERSPEDSIELMGFRKHTMETRESFRIDENLAETAGQYENPVLSGEMAKSAIYVPLVSGGKVTGVISLQSVTREHAFSASDQQLLETLAASLSVALENARLVHETRQRNAELALINSVQEAIAGELDDQAIYEAVGENIREIFDVQAVQINTLDEATGLMHFPYVIERGERLRAEPAPPGGFTRHVLETRQSLLLTENLASESERYGAVISAGEAPKSVLFVPLVVGGKAMGAISLQNADREHAFGESEQQLLETLAGSLSVALENARLVHETRQRNAELALINSVQDALAGELELQAIYDAVGDRLRDVFDAQAVFISTYDEATGLTHFPYIIERGERLHAEPGPPGGVTKHVLETRQSLLAGNVSDPADSEYGSSVLAGEWPKSGLFVPLMSGGKATGVISLQNIDRENAFAESDRQLLETLAGSLSVALENARLVHETRQRNAELALINSVQDAIAGELDQQAIYDAVGDRIRDVFDAQAVQIFMLDESTGLVQSRYLLERGQRLEEEPWAPEGFTKHVLDTRESLLAVEDVNAVAARYGSTVVEGTELPKSVLFVPLVVAGKATGVIALQNVDREHAFAESDQQLLETLAGSLSVALENARLVHETRQRNAELALINSVQDAIAGELDAQAIYDAVGDRIQAIFDAQIVAISMLDEASGLLHDPYLIERGERLEVGPPRPPSGFGGHVLETRETLLLNENLAAEAKRFGSVVTAGSGGKSVLFVPLVVSGKSTGLISLQNIDREHAFSESDQQLLETLAGSLSVALENARLVHETRQRNAELALINSVQDALAGELELQAIYDAVGDKLQEIFDAQVVDISLYEETSGLVHFPYTIERGERLHTDPIELSGFRKYVMQTRAPLMLEEITPEVSERYGNPGFLDGEPSKSALFVPLFGGGKVTGFLSLQNVDRAHAFGESDQQLL
jgi:GAF domain-containing protein